MKHIPFILVIFLCTTFFFGSAAFPAAKEVVLKNVRFGINEDRLRMVLDFENRPTYSVARKDKAVSLSIPRLNIDRLAKLLSSARYEGWILGVTVEKSQTLPTFTLQLEQNVSLVAEGMVTDTLPYRIYLDFAKNTPVVQKQQSNGQGASGGKTEQKTVQDATPKEHKDGTPAAEKTPSTPPPGADQKLEALKKQLADAPPAPPEPGREKKSEKQPEKQAEEPQTPSKAIKSPPSAEGQKPPAAVGGAAERKAPPPAPVEPPKPPAVSSNNLISGKIGDYKSLSNVEVEQKILLDRAENRYKEKDFAGAYSLLTQFRQQYPDSPFTDKAAFLQAHSFYAIKRHATLQEKQEAVGKYTLVLADYPASPEVPHALYNTGQLYLDMTFYYEALSQFSTLAAKFPDTQYGREAQFWVAESTFQLGKYADARGLLQKFINTQPESPFLKRATVRLAECYSRLNQPAEADHILKKALEKWPDLISNLPADSYLNLADYYMGQKNTDSAEEMLLLGVNIYPDSYLASRMLRQLAELYETSGSASDAGTTYYLLLHRYPESDEAQWAKVKLAEFGEKKIKLDLPEGDEVAAYYREPMEALERLLQNQLYPFREDALSELAKANMRREQYHKTLALLRQVILEFPTSPHQDAYRHDSVEAMQRLLAGSKPEEDSYNVVRTYETAFRSAGNVLADPKALMDLGKHYAVLDLLGEAVALSGKALENAAATNTMRPGILETGADWRFQAGSLDEAVEWLLMLMKEVPQDKISPSVIMKLARWRYDQKKYTEAAALFLKLLPPDDKNPDRLAANAALELGRLYLEMGFPSNALLYLKRAEDLYPPSEEKEKAAEFYGLCRLSMADSLLAQSRVPEAKDSYQKSLKGKLDSQDRAWAFYRLALIEGRMGNKEARAEALKQLSQLKEAAIWSKIGETMLRMDGAAKRAAEVL